MENNSVRAEPTGSECAIAIPLTLALADFLRSKDHALACAVRRAAASTEEESYAAHGSSPSTHPA
jgi:hypothetical protein